MRDKIKALFLAADPFHAWAHARLHDEVRAIEHAIGGRPERGRVKLSPYFAATTRDLQTALLRHDPQIVHFAGPGGGAIYLGDAYGRRGLVGTEALAELFGFLSEWVKVVVLNGCDTLPIVEALSGVVDYAIGMDQPLSDASAIVFAGAFYGALGVGKTVQASFELGVMELEAHPESTVPVLRIRTGVDPAVPLVAVPSGPGGHRGAGGTLKTFPAAEDRIENRARSTPRRRRFGHVARVGRVSRRNRLH